MDLLIVPLALVVIGLLFSVLQDARQQDLENQRARQAQKIEDQRAQVEREIEEDRAQSAAVQAYLDAMDALLRDVSLTESPDQSTFINRELARARSLKESAKATNF